MQNNKYLDAQSVYNFYKVSHLFNPKQLPCISHNIDSFTAIKDLQDPSTDLLEEFQIHVNNPDNLPNLFNANKSRILLLKQIANKVIEMPVTSINAECSFSQYKNLLNKHHKSLTPENTKQLTMLYYNGDLEKQFEDC